MDERLDNIMKELSWDRKYLFHTTDESLGEKIEAALEKSYADRESIRKQTRNQVAAYRAEIARMGELMKQKMLSSERAKECNRDLISTGRGEAGSLLTHN